MQLQPHTALLKLLHQYSVPCREAGKHAWEEPTLPHDRIIADSPDSWVDIDGRVEPRQVQLICGLGEALDKNGARLRVHRVLVQLHRAVESCYQMSVAKERNSSKQLDSFACTVQRSQDRDRDLYKLEGQGPQILTSKANMDKVKLPAARKSEVCVLSWKGQMGPL